MVNKAMRQADIQVFEISSQIYELVTVEPDPSGREKRGRKAAKTALVHSGPKFLPPLLYGRSPPTPTST